MMGVSGGGWEGRKLRAKLKLAKRGFSPCHRK